MKLKISRGLNIKYDCYDAKYKDYNNLSVDRISKINSSITGESENSVDEIVAYYILEFYNKEDGLNIFKNLVKILKVNGTLEIKVPDINRILTTLGGIKTKIDFIFGTTTINNEHIGDLGIHKYAFTYDTLKELFENNGMEVIKVYYNGTANIDLNMVGRKIK